MTRTIGLFGTLGAMLLALTLSGCGQDVVASGSGTASVPQTSTGTAEPPATTPTSTDAIAFSAEKYSVSQKAGTIKVTVTRTGTSTDATSVAFTTVNGTAIAGKDYTAATGTLSWDANDTDTKTFTVTISNTTPFTGSKAFTVALSDPTSTAEIAEPDTASVTITGDATAMQGSVELSSANYSVVQGTNNSVGVTVNRLGGSTGAASVTYSTKNGTAVAGTDFTATTGTVSWDDGDSDSKTFSVPVSKATPFSGSKTFSVALSGAKGVSLGDPASADVKINGSASAAVGSVHFSASSYTVAQTGGKVTLSVARVGGSSGAVSVAYATASGTATAGKEFTASSGTLNWAAGDSTSKTVSVPVSNGTPFSGTKAFTVALSAPTGGATINTPGSASITINGSGAAAVNNGSLSLGAASYSVDQGDGDVSITVTRSGGSSGAASVTYATSSGSAVSGSQFTAASGTLNWASGDSATKSFSVSISNATPFTGSKSFNVAISGPTGGATLGSTSSASVTITGDGSTGSTGGGSTGGLAAPGNFQMTHQGQNDAVLTWSAVSGADHYKIYRNGASYATSATTTYTDAKATNITTPGYGPEPYVAATVYSYTVSAVDASGNEGAQQKQCTAWIYHNGTDFWTTTTNNYSGGISFNVYDTGGQPQNGASADIEIKVSGGGNYWQPYSAGPFLHNMSPTQWAMELGGFHYMTLDLKPTRAGQTWSINLISRVSPGDNYNSATVVLGGSDQKFGPQSQVGKWATYKIPFLNSSGFGDGASLQMGVGTFYGSISGGTLTVTQNVSGMNVQGSSYLKGGNIIQGDSGSTGTYIGSSSGNNGMTGTYSVSPSQNVGSTLITAQRTNLYKFALMDPSGVAGNVYYVDNIGFTVQ